MLRRVYVACLEGLPFFKPVALFQRGEAGLFDSPGLTFVFLGKCGIAVGDLFSSSEKVIFRCTSNNTSYTHTHTLSLSPSVSLTQTHRHTHTHTHTLTHTHSQPHHHY